MLYQWLATTNAVPSREYVALCFSWLTFASNDVDLNEALFCNLTHKLICLARFVSDYGLNFLRIYVIFYASYEIIFRIDASTKRN